MISIVKKYVYCVLFLALPLTTTVFAQSISPQKLVFSKICAGSFNGFDATFNYTGFPSGTTFEVQLSDKTGSFTTPIVTTILSTTDVAASQKKIRFAIPTTLQGSENYKLRIKSSTGIFSASFLNTVSNTSFPVYYKPFENSFFINNKENTALLCANGGTMVLSIDNPTPNIQTSSPANYPELKYKWYKDNVLITGATTASLTVTSVGIYYAEIDYGSCSDANFSSNRVTVSHASTSVASIASSLGNTICPSISTTILSTEKGNSYQWYKDNVVIAGATNQTFETNQIGNYGVTVNFGGCESKATIMLSPITIKASLNSVSPIFIQEGATKIITVTTDVANPTISWYKNEVLLNATTNSLEVNEAGNYKVKLTHPTCPVSDEIAFVIKFSIDPSLTEIPNLISPNNDGINDTWQLPKQYTSGNDVEVSIVSPNGEEVLRTKEYLNDWPSSITNYSVYYYSISSPNEAVKKGSITVVR